MSENQLQIFEDIIKNALMSKDIDKIYKEFEHNGILIYVEFRKDYDENDDLTISFSIKISENKKGSKFRNLKTESDFFVLGRVKNDIVDWVNSVR